MLVSPRCVHRLGLRVLDSRCALRRSSKVPQEAPKVPPKPAPRSGSGEIAHKGTQGRALGELKSKRAPTVAALMLIGRNRVHETVLYDAYCNYVQAELYEDPNCVKVLWDQATEEAWMEGRRYRLVRQRFGRGVDITGPPEVLKKSFQRHYNTFEYVNEAAMFILRFRWRIWEDIGTLHVAYPIEGVQRRGKLHVRARTRHNQWILEKAWTEDPEMEIELRRRLDLEFLLNPDEEFVVELEKNSKR